jgi:hypothetical protein
MQIGKHSSTYVNVTNIQKIVDANNQPWRSAEKLIVAQYVINFRAISCNLKIYYRVNSPQTNYKLSQLDPVILPSYTFKIHFHFIFPPKSRTFN